MKKLRELSGMNQALALLDWVADECNKLPPDRLDVLLNPEQGATHDMVIALDATITKYSLTLPEIMMLLKAITSAMMRKTLSHIGESEVIDVQIPQEPQQPS